MILKLVYSNIISEYLPFEINMHPNYPRLQTDRNIKPRFILVVDIYYFYIVFIPYLNEFSISCFKCFYSSVKITVINLIEKVEM